MLHAELLDAGALWNTSGCAGALSAGEDDGGPNPGETIVRAGGGDRCPRREWQEFGLSACSSADRGLGKAPRPDSRRRDCAVADGMGVALAGCAEVPESGCPGQDAFSGILGGGGEAADTAEGERAWVRYAEYRPRRVE